ncbi:uncharacterized protein LOC128204329 [Mya arenaria]|uniref:uncharacterized protein LOC128204329 n=1 Tax=Mya arenaria TaxID=6604 RepID=UPI0022E2E73B|nr:uncharacterized protein LOC128204329 [Mya arenaria]
MLIAYKRTGSTFLGDLLGRRADVFYWYEPLAEGRIKNYLKGRNLLCEYSKPSCRNISEADEKSAVNAISHLSDIFSCNVARRVNQISSLDYIWKLTPASWRPFVNCTKNLGNRHVQRCAHVLQDSCKHSQHRMVKILRIDVEIVGSMLESNPRLKMVLLFRDPRGSMNSRLTTTWYRKFVNTDSKKSDDAEVLCSRLTDDISAGKILKAKFPGRVILLQYEDFDGYEDKLHMLYDFLNIGPPKEGAVTVFKKGEHVNHKAAGFHPFNYRHEMSFRVNEIINVHCSDVYKELGLRQFDNENDYKNDNISVIIDKLPFAIMP